jgi:hypothetical protein
MIGVILAAAVTVSPAPNPVRSMLDSFAQDADATHGAELAAAVAASPKLADQLGLLAVRGQLRGFALRPAPAQGAGAWSEAGVISFTPLFLDRQSHPTSRLDTVDYAPDELVFILGVMASRLETEAATAVAASDQARAAYEARAFLQGWNDELDAAIQAKGALLTAGEAFDLLKKGVNSKVIGAAATLAPDKRLIPSDVFTFPPSDHNVEAVASVLLAAKAR